MTSWLFASRRRLLVAVATLVIAPVLAVQGIRAETLRLHKLGIYEELEIPPGSVDVLLSEDGSLATISAVTFNRDRREPERVVLAVNLEARRVVWRRALPSSSCCAFPVLAMTPAGDAIVVGGGEETPVYGQDGWQMFSVTLTDGRVHSMASVSHDGKFLVIGEAEGRVAAFARARSVPLWVEELQGRLLALTLSGNGKVVAAVLRDQWLLLRAADGSVMTRRVYGPARIATTAVSWDGGRMGLLWKRLDGRMVVEFLNQRRIVFARELGRGTVPLLQMDDRGHWLAVGDVLGMTAALYSSTGRLVWEGREIRRAAVAVAPDGSQAAVAQGRSVQVLSLPSGRPIWRSRLPGAPHLLRLAGPRLAILGSLGLDAGIPDRVWFLARGRL